MAALSNNPLPVIQDQMRANGLSGYFTAVMSVDEAEALKPAPEVYQFACRRLGLEPGDAWMVAAHGLGISRARPAPECAAHSSPAPDNRRTRPPAPEIVGPDLNAVSRAIIAAEALR